MDGLLVEEGDAERIFGGVFRMLEMRDRKPGVMNCIIRFVSLEPAIK